MITRLLIFTSCLLFSLYSFGQTYTMTNGTVSACTGTFYDPGGTGNYANSQNFTYTICNTTAGQPIYMTFSAFQTESSFDYLYIYNGPNTASPLIGTYTGTTNPGSITGTTGCLTFVFTSDGSITYPGWTASISCVAPPPVPCNPATNVLCGTITQPTSPNSVNQGTVGCLSSTYNQTLYSIQPTTSGNITYTITSGCDVDFALWGPFATIPCGIPGTATIDCSFSASATEYADITNAVPGQYYILLISNYCNVATNVNLTPSGTAAGGIACTSGCVLTASAVPGAISCNGGTTSITVTATGGSGYTYAISPNTPGITLSGNVFSNVPAGNYTITTTSASPVCSTATAVNITQPTALSASNSFSPILCNGGTSTITVSASGGVPGYQYSLNGGAFQAGNTFTVSAGTYTIAVQDANGCQVNTSATITEPASALGISHTTTPILCNAGTSTVTVSASGGTPNYQYSINGSPLQGSNIFNNIFAGNYTLLVQDANGCQATLAINISEPTSLTATNAFLPIPCISGTSDITITASGGTPNYQYSLNGGAFQAVNSFTGLSAGLYTITVRDTNLCQTTTTANITQPTALNASALASSILCNGGTSDITVTTTGGTPNYQYSLNGGTWQLSNVFIGVDTGSYSILIQDANNCQTSASVSISEPSALNLSASAPPIACNGGTTVITASVTGGTPNYQYSLNGSPLQGGNTFSNIFVGNYIITAQDANGCSTSVPLTTTEPAAALAVTNVSEICNISGNSYTISFDVSGGTTPYSVSGVSGSFTGNTFTSTPISTGTTPVLSVTDNNLCSPITVNTQGNCTPAQACNTVTGCFGGSTIINGDFESFDPLNPFANFTSHYDYYDCDAGNSPCINGTTGQNILCQYDFAVETGTPACNNTWSSNIADHTSGTGNMMLVDFPTGNVAPNNNIWCQTVNLLPNTDYCFGAYFLNLVPNGTNFTNPIFEFQGNGVTLGTTIGIPEDEQWHFEGVQFNSSAGGTTNMCLLNSNYGFLGYDLAIDDIVLREVGAGTPPTAFADNAILCDNINFISIDVLANDLGANIDPNTLQLVSYPAFSVGNAVVSGGQIVFTPDPSFTGSTSFTYKVSNTSGCSDMATITVTEVAHPQPNISGTNTFCQGQSALLDAGAGYLAYTWTTPMGLASSQTVTATTTGQYIVVVMDANLCLGDDTLDITVNPLPTPIITAPTTAICQGSSVSLDAGAGYNSYSWFQTSPSVALGTSQTQSVSTANEFGVVVTNGFNCSGQDTISIIVNPLPVVAISQVPANPVCPGSSATLSATTGYNAYSWFGTATSIGGNADTLVVNATDTYNVQATDTNGCQNTASIGTLFQDLVPPTIQNCPANINTAADPNACTANVTWIAPTANDNCSVSIVQTSGIANGGAFPIGTSMVSYTATDAGGNTAICSFTITVTDNQSPVIVNCPNNIILNNTAGQCGAVATWTAPTATDNCSVSIAQTFGSPSGSVFPVGNSTITYTATDAAGNTATCSFIITIIDNEVPVVLNCPANIAVNNATNQCAANVSWIAPTVSDNCSGASIVQTQGLASGSSFPVGTSTITYTATDAAGNTATCSFTVTVSDTDAPTFTLCPSNINLTTSATCDAIATWTTPTATDNCGSVAVAQTQGPLSGAVFTLGTTTVTYLATDAAGNTATCSFTVTVSDATAPVISSCPNNINLSSNAGQCGAITNWNAPTAADNCGTASISQTSGPANGSLFPIGTTTVVYTATDAAGNSSNCSFTVTVADTEAPTIVGCPANITLQATNGCSTAVSWNVPIALDNCSGVTLVGSNNPGDIFNVGMPTVVTYTATDASGNTAVCTFTVTITPPSILTLNTTSSIATCNGGADGTATASVSGGSGTYSYSWTTSPAQTTATATGLSAGTYTVFVTDANAAACVLPVSATITITQNPALAATGISLQDDNCGQSTGIATVTVTGGSQNYNYSWNTVPPQTTAVATGLTAGTYTVTVADAQNSNCTTTASVSILGVPVPNVSLSPTGFITLCQGGTVLLSASGANSYQWLWNGTPINIGTTLTAQQAGTYQVVGYSGANVSGCTDTSTTVNVTVGFPPVAGIKAETPTHVCEGQTVTLSALGNGSYTWLKDGIVTGETAQTITATSGGSYTVVVINACGTDTSTNIITQFNTLPVADFLAIPTIGTVEEPTLFIDKSTDAATWTWSFGDGSAAVMQQNPTYTYFQTGTYNVTLWVTDAIGCGATVDHLVTINPKDPIFIPNTFTPNGDGSHDEFLVSYNEVDMKSFEIFDRWGNSVFVTKDPQKGWNGNNKNGIPCVSGVYYYIVDGEDYQKRAIVHKGFVNLLR